MFLEIAFIQKLMLFLHYPVYAVAVVLTAFLFFSGVGSFVADKLQARSRLAQPIGIAALLSVVAVLVGVAGGLFSAGSGWPDAARVVSAVALLAPLAFLMGLPFPLGLQRVSDSARGLVPWAWAINGCFSVTGATVATLIAVHLGFRVLVLLAALCYLATVPVFRRLHGAPDTRAG
jgi:hypothetical protein